MDNKKHENTQNQNRTGATQAQDNERKIDNSNNTAVSDLDSGNNTFDKIRTVSKHGKIETDGIANSAEQAVKNEYSQSAVSQADSEIKKYADLLGVNQATTWAKAKHAQHNLDVAGNKAQKQYVKNVSIAQEVQKEIQPELRRINEEIERKKDLKQSTKDLEKEKKKLEKEEWKAGQSKYGGYNVYGDSMGELKGRDAITTRSKQIDQMLRDVSIGQNIIDTKNFSFISYKRQIRKANKRGDRLTADLLRSNRAIDKLQKKNAAADAMSGNRLNHAKSLARFATSETDGGAGIRTVNTARKTIKTTKKAGKKILVSSVRGASSAIFKTASVAGSAKAMFSKTEDAKKKAKKFSSNMKIKNSKFQSQVTKVSNFSVKGKVKGAINQKKKDTAKKLAKTGMGKFLSGIKNSPFGKVVGAPFKGISKAMHGVGSAVGSAFNFLNAVKKKLIIFLAILFIPPVLMSGALVFGGGGSSSNDKESEKSSNDKESEKTDTAEESEEEDAYIISQSQIAIDIGFYMQQRLENQFNSTPANKDRIVDFEDLYKDYLNECGVTENTIRAITDIWMSKNNPVDSAVYSSPFINETEQNKDTCMYNRKNVYGKDGLYDFSHYFGPATQVQVVKVRVPIKYEAYYYDSSHNKWVQKKDKDGNIELHERYTTANVNILGCGGMTGDVYLPDDFFEYDWDVVTIYNGGGIPPYSRREQVISGVSPKYGGVYDITRADGVYKNTKSENDSEMFKQLLTKENPYLLLKTSYAGSLYSDDSIDPSGMYNTYPSWYPGEVKELIADGESLNSEEVVEMEQVYNIDSLYRACLCMAIGMTLNEEVEDREFILFFNEAFQHVMNNNVNLSISTVYQEDPAGGITVYYPTASGYNKGTGKSYIARTTVRINYKVGLPEVLSYFTRKYSDADLKEIAWRQDKTNEINELKESLEDGDITDGEYNEKYDEITDEYDVHKAEKLLDYDGWFDEEGEYGSVLEEVYDFYDMEEEEWIETFDNTTMPSTVLKGDVLSDDVIDDIIGDLWARSENDMTTRKEEWFRFALSCIGNFYYQGGGKPNEIPYTYPYLDCAGFVWYTTYMGGVEPVLTQKNGSNMWNYYVKYKFNGDFDSLPCGAIITKYDTAQGMNGHIVIYLGKMKLKDDLEPRHYCIECTTTDVSGPQLSSPERMNCISRYGYYCYPFGYGIRNN